MTAKMLGRNDSKYTVVEESVFPEQNMQQSATDHRSLL
jgi:hypothetical protein